MKPRTLFREEEAELVRSNKKVKDYHHSGYNEGSRESSPPPGFQNAESVDRASFEEKLVGEMPGAYAKAFDFDSLMEEDDGSDGEDGEDNGQIRDGWVSYKLTKETKRRIRGPWSKLIIVKLVGRTNSLIYMRSKLNQMWRPTSRMDCVDLGIGFFLVRFYSKEDLDSVLKKGPWFIGDQFLSIRPWEPFFKPSTVNVSLIVVWIRLYELPIELYEAEIDINQPLVNTILIGHFEQAVSYEGIQSLCFSCGRLGHKVEACPYTIRKSKENVAPVEEGLPNQGEPLHGAHDGQGAQAGTDMAEVVTNTMEDGQYGSWMVVSRRTSGRKGTYSLVSTDSTNKSARNATPQQTPKNSEWRGTSKGPAQVQYMPRKDRFHGSGGHYKRTEPVWSPIVFGLGYTDMRESVDLGPVESVLSTKEANVHDNGNGLRPSLYSQAQLHRKYLNSVKGKKVLARGLSTLPNTNRSSVRNLPVAKANPLPPFHASLPKRVPPFPVDHAFKFTAFSNVPSLPEVSTVNSDGKLGESSNCKPIVEEYGQPISVGDEDIIVEELSSPCSKEGSIYEEVGMDGLVSEGGDGIPPSE
nr:hypothetical protein CFP56_61683 [Quercus suber]